jgi:hypothetical protein
MRGAEGGIDRVVGSWLARPQWHPVTSFASVRPDLGGVPGSLHS